MMIKQDREFAAGIRTAAESKEANEYFSAVLPEARKKVVGADGRLAVSLNEAAAMIGSSRRSLENYIAAKLLPSRKIGKRRIILVRDLKIFLERDQPSPTTLLKSQR